MEKKPIVIVIVGPTASGKTAVSIELAKKLDGEIVSADSMQIYKEMNIGTAKPTITEMDGIKHYLIDVISPEEDFSVIKYQELATQAIEEILKNGKTPIVVGGTGLYVSSLTNAIEFSVIPENIELRKKLEDDFEKFGKEYLYDELLKVDPESAKVIDKNNVRRVIRALEIFKTSGITKTELDKNSIKEPKYDYRLYGISWDREKLYERIDKRVDIMLEDGLVEEVRDLMGKYNLSKTSLQGIGYKEVISYLDGEISYDEMVDKIKLETRHYAKRQLTWFRRDARIKWFSKEDIVSNVLKEVKES